MADRASGSFLKQWSKKRKTRHDAKHLLAETRRILRKHSQRIAPAVVDEIRGAAEALQEALDGEQLSAIRDRLGKLDELVEKHLAFGRKSALREYAESIGVAVLVALFLRAFVLEAFKIPSGSMLPTLEVGDHIFVNKFLYGLRVPWTYLKFMELRKPRRGEVIVFIYPVKPYQDFIKRIVAVEGDTIALEKNTLILNGKPVKRTKLDEPCVLPPEPTDGQEHSVPPTEEELRCSAYIEELDGFKYRVYQQEQRTPPMDRRPVKIPPGHVFVMGDNRDNSLDSRFWGTVPDANIKGKAMIIWWSGNLHRFFHLVHSAP